MSFAKYNECIGDGGDDDCGQYGATMSNGQHVTEAPNNNKKHIELCVMFVKLGEIDTAHEQFSADVIVKARWREESLDGMRTTIDLSNSSWKTKVYDPKLFIENTIGDHKESISQHVIFNDNEEAFVCENRRVKATFVENLELNDFPFDVQDLTVVVASERFSSEIHFTDNSQDMHRVCKRSFVDEQEWMLYKHIDTERTTILVRVEISGVDRRFAVLVTYFHKSSYSDDLGNSDHLSKPMYLVRCRAARRSRFFLANMYTMAFLIVMLTFTTFSVKYSKPEYRLKLTFALLLTSVTFKLVVSNSLPKISYVTYLDQYNFAALGMIVLTCIWHSICSTLSTDIVLLADRVALAVLGFAFLVFNIVYGVYIYIKVYSKRRLMELKDEEYLKMTNNLAQQISEKERFSLNVEI